MPETSTDLGKDLCQRWGAEFAKRPDMPLDEWRAMVEEWPQLTAEPGGVDYVEVDANGVPAMWATPKGAAEDRVVLAFHGGGFVTGSMYTHRKLFGHLAKAIGGRALVSDYRRAPEHTHPAPVEDALTAYRWLLDQGKRIPAHRIRRRFGRRRNDRHHHAPGPPPRAAPARGGHAAVVLVRLRSHQRLVTPQRRQGRPAEQGARPGARRHVPGRIRKPARPLLMDSRLFADRARQAGVDVRVDLFLGQQQTFQMAVGRSKDAAEAMRRLADLAHPKLGP